MDPSVTRSGFGYGPSAVSDAETIARLAEQIRHHRDRYYNDEPDITDAEFDALEDRLRSLAPDHEVLGEVGAAPADEAANAEQESEAAALVEDRDADALATRLRSEQNRFYAGKTADPKMYLGLYVALERAAPEHPTLARVVPPRGRDWVKAAHEIPMGSLNKVNTEQELTDWAARCDELAEAAELEPTADDLSVTEKLDGISIEVLYDHGEIEAAITRGDGIVGERITPNVEKMQGVPSHIPHEGRISVRGEIILTKKDAERFAEHKKRVDPKFTVVKSLRNTAAGIARTKDPKLLPGCPMLTILFYDVEGVEGLEDEKDKLDFIVKQGFATPYVDFGDVAQMIAIWKHYEDEKRAKLDYEIDGLVVRANRLRTFHLLGELNHRPRAAVAFKFGNEMQVTTLRGIQWSTGDSGRITPIAQIDPVFLAGAEVRQASLHNIAKVRSMQIGVGDQVLVSRRNDVIPYVEKVVVHGPNEEEAPTACAACGEPVAVSGEYLVCENLMCPARRLGRLKTWVKHLGLLEWGEKTFVRLLDEGLVAEPADLYRLTVDDIAGLSGYGELSAQKLLAPLAEKKELPLPTFIAALGIPSVSKETAKLLLGAGFESVDAILEASPESLAEIEGLGSIKADKILTGLASRKEEIERLQAVGVRTTTLEESGPLAGLSFCFSGPASRPRKELQAIVENNGGVVSAGVKKGLTYLVLSDASSTSSKAQKARKLGTEIIDEGAFEALVTERGGSTELS